MTVVNTFSLTGQLFRWPFYCAKTQIYNIFIFSLDFLLAGFPVILSLS